MDRTSRAADTVRSELDSFSSDLVVDLVTSFKGFLREYHLKLRASGRVDDAYAFGLADRIAADARSHPNVIRVDGLRRATGSIARKGRADVHVVAVEPTTQGTYVLSRLHYSIDRAGMSWSWDDGRINFVPHMAERLLERGDPSGEGMRRAGRALYAAAGMFALGARPWSMLEPGPRTWRSVALPTGDGGLLMGSLVTNNMTCGAVKVGAGRLTKFGPREVDVPVPGVAILPRMVHATPDQQLVASFGAMTYIGPRDLNPRKERVRDLLAGIRDRHPVVALAGMAWLWPTSRAVQEQFAARRGEFAKAYEDLLSIHDDPDVAAVFGRRTWRTPPPLPWEERPEDVRHNIIAEVSRWASPDETAEAMRNQFLAWKDRQDPEPDQAPRP